MAWKGSIMSDIELWAGAECTVNRVGERWFDQVCRTGHHERQDDMDRLAALGVSRVRFPVLWERVAPQGLSRADWSWTDARLSRLRSLGIAPIVGLVHHGSGPAGTDLSDPGFVDGLAAFAEAVARRYPWVQELTPINEPLTTARFGALYGHWYPHARNTSAFLQALVHEVRATVAAMQRIREVTPGARLVQTEDLGRVSSTPALDYQRRYEAARRWLSLDLLTGRVDDGHPLRQHLEQHGVTAAELDALVERPCPPDVVGINYYLTSDRHLDERLELYPPCHHGGNGWQRYADVEAVRVGEVGIAGHRAILEEAWQRYAIPVAITEVHVGCTREEQLRWLHEAWRAAVDARAAGVDVRAVTLWSVFGAVDWHCLVTRAEDRYEPGIYDVRAPVPRPTALATLAAELAEGRSPSHPLLAGPGWWASSRRRLYGEPVHEPHDGDAPVRPLLVVGTGKLAERLAQRCARRGIPCWRMARLDRRPSWPMLEPWATVIVPDASGRRWCDDETLAGLLWLARACEARGLPVVAFSSHLVFEGGRTTRPWVESDPTRSHTTATSDIAASGKAYRRFEAWIRSAAPNALVVRTGLVCDPEDPADPLARVLAALAGPAPVRVPDDEIVAASVLPQLLDATLDLLVDGERGVWHGTNPGERSLHELVRTAARHARMPTERLEPGRSSRAWGLELGPGMRAIASERAWPMPDLDAALAGYAALAGEAAASEPDLRCATSAA
jgi:dTDP-4-dehydrorhamnose reductase